MPNYLPRPADIRDATRYRRLRELIEYGDFLMQDVRGDKSPSDIDYGRELDKALDDPDTAKRGDILIKLREAKQQSPKGGENDK